MKRTLLRLSELNKGDVFYFTDDKKRETFRYIGEGDPQTGFNYTRQTIRIQPTSAKGNAASDVPAVSMVVKVEI